MNLFNKFLEQEEKREENIKIFFLLIEFLRTHGIQQAFCELTKNFDITKPKKYFNDMAKESLIGYIIQKDWHDTLIKFQSKKTTEELYKEQKIKDAIKKEKAKQEAKKRHRTRQNKNKLHLYVKDDILQIKYKKFILYKIYGRVNVIINTWYGNDTKEQIISDLQKRRWKHENISSDQKIRWCNQVYCIKKGILWNAIKGQKILNILFNTPIQNNDKNFKKIGNSDFPLIR